MVILISIIGFQKPILIKTILFLDVGAGKGELLLKLQNVGFKNLTGIDPFLEKEITYNKDLKILKLELSELNNLSFRLGDVSSCF